MDNFIWTTIGRCNDLGTHPDFETIKDTFSQFVVVSQFKDQPRSFEEVLVRSVTEGGMRVISKAQSSLGTYLYGVNKDRTLKLLQINTDSSD